MSTDLHTLSGAYALDALSAEDAAEFRTHLAGCQACRDEVRELREAAGRMGASEAVVAPPHLRARVLAAAAQQPQLPPVVRRLDAARPRRWTGRLLVAAAAVVLVVVGGIGISQVLDRNSQPVMAASVAQVFHAPDAHTTKLPTGNGGTITIATSRELRKMALNTDALPALGSGQVYQVWAIRGGVPSSAGLVSDLEAGKAMSLPAAGTQVAITVEPSGGSPKPTTQPIVLVNPSQA
jgi:anti-sigma-K factor RskA